MARHRAGGAPRRRPTTFPQRQVRLLWLRPPRDARPAFGARRCRRGGGTMRRLLRWTFHALAAASLLLCLATAWLWVRSYWVADELIALRTDGRLGIDQYLFDAGSRAGQFTGLVAWYVLPEPDPAARWKVMLNHENDE